MGHCMKILLLAVTALLASQAAIAGHHEPSENQLLQRHSQSWSKRFYRQRSVSKVHRLFYVSQPVPTCKHGICPCKSQVLLRLEGRQKGRPRHDAGYKIFVRVLFSSAGRLEGLPKAWLDVPKHPSRHRKSNPCQGLLAGAAND